MFCKKCPHPVTAVVRPDVACKGKCGKLIKGHLSYCPECSKRLKKCEQCGAKVN